GLRDAVARGLGVPRAVGGRHRRRRAGAAQHAESGAQRRKQTEPGSSLPHRSTVNTHIRQSALRFSHTELTDSELALQASVRDFLAAELPRGEFTPGLGMASPRDQEFSRKLAQRGWLGMALASEYGGRDGTEVERFVVVEELLRWGAPVGYHWVADRQTGPVIARFGSEEQKRRFLPAICNGEVSFSIGMSEPEAGS